MLVFALLATANSGGYRYGVGDQAFYIPATEFRLSPDAFPRDRALIESQARLTIIDEALAASARVTGADLPTLFLALYALTLVTIAIGADRLARALGGSRWTSAAVVLLLTLRHRIAKTGANTLEGYMHPRMLAFGVGLFALTAALERRWRWTVALWALAAVIHPTTALWFAVLIAGGLVARPVVLARGGRALAAILLASAVVLAAGVLGLGDRLARHLPADRLMDPAWLAVFADKDYLFVSTWPAYAWALNLAYLPMLWWLYQQRRAAGAASPADDHLVAGAVVLFAAFAGSVLCSEARVAFAVQLQVSRVFWLLDLLLTVYGAWWLTASTWITRRSARAPAVVLAVIALCAAGRGAYTLATAPDDRAFVRSALAPSAWADTMTWLRSQPADWLVLAHPDHAWRYGSSVRVAAGRDVVVESVKDAAIAMYDRETAMRVAERLAALAQFDHLSAEEARAIGRRYGATVLVADAARPLSLPALHANDGFVVYDLR